VLQALGVIDQTHKLLCRSGVYMFGNRDAGKPVMLPVGHNVMRFPRFFVCQEATGFMLPASRAAVDSIH
jgi:hypothetical protein